VNITDANYLAQMGSPDNKSPGSKPTTFLNMNSNIARMLPPNAASPPGGNTWVLPALLSSFQEDDDGDDGDDDQRNTEGGAEEDKGDKQRAGDDQSNEASDASKSIKGLCQGWFEGAVDEFQEVAEDMTTRVAGLKSIFQNNKADKKLLVALKPFMKKTSATVKATNQAIEAVAKLTGFQSRRRRECFLQRAAERLRQSEHSLAHDGLCPLFQPGPQCQPAGTMQD
jgi:hypothetical protein